MNKLFKSQILFALHPSIWVWICVLFPSLGWAQLTGTYTVGGSSTPDYATIQAAITALNSSGVGLGGVTFNVAAGHTETGANILITATGTSGSPIVFQKSGVGVNPKIRASAGSGASDGIIEVQGGDFITFDGIDLVDSSSNITNTSKMEAGYSFVPSSSTNGCQYNTVKNCTITLSSTNTGSPYTSGINFFRGTIASYISPSNATVLAGTNSFNRITNNLIIGCRTSINVVGSSSVLYYDRGNWIGTSISTGNVVSNWGQGSISNYGIYVLYQDTVRIIGNAITSPNTITTATMYGILLSSSAKNCVIDSNTVSGTSSSSFYAIHLSTVNTNTMFRSNHVNLTSSNGAYLRAYYLSTVHTSTVIKHNTCDLSSSGNENYGLFWSGGTNSSECSNNNFIVR
ncbi:MAG: hypothetical protein KDC37_07540, partial [Flavobacteriales bacterium]|nr:hypothetical protein [Flavobacteriales bacterium]